MDKILQLVEKYGTCQKFTLKSGRAIRRFPIGDMHKTDKKYNYALNRWYPGNDSLTTQDALKGLSLISWRLALLVNLTSEQVYVPGDENTNSYFSFPINDFLKEFPSCRVSLSPDFTNDTEHYRGFCHLTLHIEATPTQTRKSIWKDIRDWLIEHSKTNYEDAYLKLPN